MKSYTVHEADQMASFVRGMFDLCKAHEAYSAIFIEDIYDLGRECEVFKGGSWEDFQIEDWI